MVYQGRMNMFEYALYALVALGLILATLVPERRGAHGLPYPLALRRVRSRRGHK